MFVVDDFLLAEACRALNISQADARRMAEPSESEAVAGGSVAGQRQAD